MLSVKQFMGWVISQSWIKCPQKEAKYVQTSLVIHGEVGREIWDLDTREHCQIGLTRKHAQWVKRSCLLLDLPWTHRTSMHETWQKYMYNAAIEMLHIQRLFLERFTATACVHWHSQQKQCLGTKDILQPKWAPSIPLSCKRFLPPPPITSRLTQNCFHVSQSSCRVDADWDCNSFCKAVQRCIAFHNSCIFSVLASDQDSLVCCRSQWPFCCSHDRRHWHLLVP